MLLATGKMKFLIAKQKCFDLNNLLIVKSHLKLLKNAFHSFPFSVSKLRVTLLWPKDGQGTTPPGAEFFLGVARRGPDKPHLTPRHESHPIPPVQRHRVGDGCSGPAARTPRGGDAAAWCCAQAALGQYPERAFLQNKSHPRDLGKGSFSASARGSAVPEAVPPSPGSPGAVSAAGCRFIKPCSKKNLIDGGLR